jgi:salicylate hydroxylase
MHPEAIITRSALDDTVLHEMKLQGEMEGKYGAPWLHISRTTLHKALVDEAVRLGVLFRLGCNVVGIDFTNADKPAVMIQSGEVVSGDVVVGADGIHSVCREQLLGGMEGVVRSGDMVYRLTLPTFSMRKHPDAAVRDLAMRTDFNYWAGPNGHAVGYLIEGGSKFNIVISASDNLPKGFEKGKGDVRELRERFKDWKGRTFAGLPEMASEVNVWRLFYGRELESWRGRGRVVLVGDAVHAMLPYLCVFPSFNPQSNLR